MGRHRAGGKHTPKPNTYIYKHNNTYYNILWNKGLGYTPSHAEVCWVNKKGNIKQMASTACQGIVQWKGPWKTYQPQKTQQTIQYVPQSKQFVTQSTIIVS